MQRIDPATGNPIGHVIDVEAEERERARMNLPDSEGRYVETNNPVYAWEAFLESRIAGVEPPASVLAYLERCAHRITRLARENIPTKGTIVPAIAEATEFVSKGRNGRSNPLRAIVDTSRSVLIATEVYFRLQQGEQLKYAREHVAKHHGIDPRTVGRHWRTNAHMYPPVPQDK